MHGLAHLFGQHGADQVLGALADEALDARAIDARKGQVDQHGVERGFEIAERVDERAVEIDDGGVEAGEVHGRGKAAKGQREAQG